jgi:hypothetical protein
MLSERDSRILREIEQHLAAEDPGLAMTVQRQGRRQQRREHLTRAGYDATAAIAALLAIVCFVLPGAIAAGLTAATLAFAAFAVRRVRYSTRPIPAFAVNLGNRWREHPDPGPLAGHGYEW